uniref:Protein kinase domain-containing protein n=1 Tax=Palpitomonas bilix TaxID=652834 RepID=A0A7S3LWQ9_9EUKA
MGRSKKGKKKAEKVKAILKSADMVPLSAEDDERYDDLRQTTEEALINAAQKMDPSKLSAEALNNAWTKLYCSCREMAEAGDLGALTVMAECYAAGIEGYFERDFKKAVELFQFAAEQNHPPAQNGLGVLYALGHGVPKNMNTSKDLFERALAGGDKRAAANLGNLHQYCVEEGVHQDLKKAIDFYENGALGNDARSQYHFGLALLEGAGVEQDLKMGVTYIQMAAQKHNPEAEATLGMCFQYGLVVPQNLKRALTLYRMAAVRGCKRAEEKARELEDQGVVATEEESKEKAIAQSSKVAKPKEEKGRQPSLSIHFCCYLFDKFGFREKIKTLLMRSQTKSMLAYKSLQSALVSEVGLTVDDGARIENAAIEFRAKGYQSIGPNDGLYPFYAEPSYLRYSLHGGQVFVENSEVQRRRPSCMWYERDVLVDFKPYVGKYLFLSELDTDRRDFKASLNTILQSKIKKLSLLRHKNLVPVKGVIDRTNHPINQCIIVVYSPWSESSLFSLLRHVNPYDHLELSLRERLLLALDIARGTEYCHSNDVIHGDLSTENILVQKRTKKECDGQSSARYTVAISEYGLDPLSQLRHPGEAQRVLWGSSLAWLAPERLLGELKSTGPTFAVDIWSLGLIIWELWTGEKPWREVRSVLDLVNRVMEGDERPEMPPQEGYEEDDEFMERPFYDLLCDTIRRCWARNPKERPGASAVCNSLEKVIDNLKRLKEGS